MSHNRPMHRVYAVIIKKEGREKGTKPAAGRVSFRFVGMKTRVVGIVATPAGFEPATPSLEGWSRALFCLVFLPACRVLVAAAFADAFGERSPFPTCSYVTLGYWPVLTPSSLSDSRD
jgi:hypothetical protein